MASHAPRKGASWLLALFLIPLVFLMWPRFYNRVTPELSGIPFFYWIQLAAILVTALLTLVAYLGRA